MIPDRVDPLEALAQARLVEDEEILVSHEEVMRIAGVTAEDLTSIEAEFE